MKKVIAAVNREIEDLKKTFGTDLVNSNHEFVMADQVAGILSSNNIDDLATIRYLMESCERSVRNKKSLGVLKKIKSDTARDVAENLIATLGVSYSAEIFSEIGAKRQLEIEISEFRSIFNEVSPENIQTIIQKVESLRSSDDSSQFNDLANPEVQERLTQLCKDAETYSDLATSARRARDLFLQAQLSLLAGKIHVSEKLTYPDCVALIHEKITGRKKSNVNSSPRGR